MAEADAMKKLKKALDSLDGRIDSIKDEADAAASAHTKDLKNAMDKLSSKVDKVKDLRSGIHEKATTKDSKEMEKRLADAAEKLGALGDVRSMAGKNQKYLKQ